MKKLSKLQVRPDKLMMDEELKTLRGGYDFGICVGILCDTQEVLYYTFAHDFIECRDLCFPECYKFYSQ